ncbi:MAG: hypothetical protein K6G62_01760 [Eubacterium sp.]|nr:hypothetical protein [Eubacterium sp.]
MFIICQGKLAKEPYLMPFVDKAFYSLEELCAYLYENIYSINVEFFQSSLADWLEEETDNGALAKKLRYALEQGPSLKDLVVLLLCGCDYYKEDEIRKLIVIMDGIANLPLHQKRKIKADNFLRAGRYGKSLLEYRRLLHGGLAMNFSTEEYGDLLHNQGIAHFHTSSFVRAEKDFKEAYARNGAKSSLKHYLWTLLIQDKEKLFAEEAIHYGISPEEAKAIRLRYVEATARVEFSGDSSQEKLEQYGAELRQAFAF